MVLDDFKEEQKIAYQVLKNSLLNNKVGHAYIFETREYHKTFDFVLSFAKYLLCPYNYTNSNKCVNCTQCENINKNVFSEIKIIEPDGLWIKKEQLDELQKEFSTKSIEASKKIYIIKNADRLNPSSANSILKFLEEPEDNIIALLITDNLYQLMDTIISRCQVITLDKKIDYKQLDIIDRIRETINIPDTLLEEPDILKEKIDIILKFINFYEIQKINTLVNTQNLFHNYIKTKDELFFTFDVIMLYYKDLLNVKLNKSLEIFDKENFQNKILENNNITKIINKIKKISKNREKIKYNANTNLLIDKLIIELDKE